MQFKPKNNCPLNNFEPCKQLECGWFIKVEGENPNTGEKVEDWGCAVAYLPMLLIENAKHTRHTGAAVESFRNEMVKQSEQTNKIFIAAATGNLRIEG